MAPQSREPFCLFQSSWQTPQQIQSHTKKVDPSCQFKDFISDKSVWQTYEKIMFMLDSQQWQTGRKTDLKSTALFSSQSVIVHHYRSVSSRLLFLYRLSSLAAILCLSVASRILTGFSRSVAEYPDISGEFYLDHSLSRWTAFS